MEQYSMMGILGRAFAEGDLDALPLLIPLMVVIKK